MEKPLAIRILEHLDNHYQSGEGVIMDGFFEEQFGGALNQVQWKGVIPVINTLESEDKIMLHNGVRTLLGYKAVSFPVRDNDFNVAKNVLLSIKEKGHNQIEALNKKEVVPIVDNSQHLTVHGDMNAPAIQSTGSSRNELINPKTQTTKIKPKHTKAKTSLLEKLTWIAGIILAIVGIIGLFLK